MPAEREPDSLYTGAPVTSDLVPTQGCLLYVKTGSRFMLYRTLDKRQNVWLADDERTRDEHAEREKAYRDKAHHANMPARDIRCVVKFAAGSQQQNNDMFHDEFALMERLNHQRDDLFLPVSYFAANSCLDLNSDIPARLSHPPFMVLPYCSGGSLFDWQQRLPSEFDERLDKVLRLLQRLLKIAAFLATEGIVHRDISPGNVVVDGQERAFLIDYERASSQGLDKYARGTSGFQPPEIDGGQAADSRADQYSLAAVAYFLLAQQAPAQEPVHTREAVRRFSEKHDCAELGEVLTKALSDTPEVRYCDIPNFADALQQAFAAYQQRQQYDPILACKRKLDDLILTVQTDIALCQQAREGLLEQYQQLHSVQQLISTTGQNAPPAIESAAQRVQARQAEVHEQISVLDDLQEAAKARRLTYRQQLNGLDAGDAAHAEALLATLDSAPVIEITEAGPLKMATLIGVLQEAQPVGFEKAWAARQQTITALQALAEGFRQQLGEVASQAVGAARQLLENLQALITSEQQQLSAAKQASVAPFYPSPVDAAAWCAYLELYLQWYGALQAYQAKLGQPDATLEKAYWQRQWQALQKAQRPTTRWPWLVLGAIFLGLTLVPAVAVMFALLPYL